MKTGKIRNISVFLLCLVVAAGLIFATPEQAQAKSKKPPRVTSFRVTSTDYDAVYLKWGAQKGIKTYRIYRATSKGGRYKLLKTSSKNTFKDIYVQTGVTYWYKVRAEKGFSKGRFSVIVKGTPRPKTPKFNAVSRTNGAKLTAKAVRGASGYIFYRNGRAIRMQKGCVYTDTNAPGMRTAMYKVAAYRVVKGKRIASYYSRQLPASKITATVKLEKCTLPTTIDSGSRLKNTGTIKANIRFTKVEIGIVRDKSWVRKYQVGGLNTKVFDISNANSAFTFNNLPGGTYKYRIYVHFEDGIVHTALNHPFTVSNPALSKYVVKTRGVQGAIDWAKMIANDNSFAYGEGQRAHKRGCAICGTNSKYKPKGYERTYCCNPFIFAAYAHGAKNAKMLKACSNGACGGMVPSDWTRYGCFKTVGKTRQVPYSSLKAGDVIISSPDRLCGYNHVWMFIGNGQYVDAGYEGWGAGTIAVRGNAKGTYSKYQGNECFVMRYTGN